LVRHQGSSVGAYAYEDEPHSEKTRADKMFWRTDMKKHPMILTMAMMISVLLGCANMQPTPADSADASPILDRILSRGELRVGMSGDMPPMNMTTKEDKLIGLDADLAAIIADAMNVKLSLQPIPFSELLPALEAGRIDMIIANMTITPARNLKAVFVGPYFVSGKGLLTKRSTLVTVERIEELNRPDFTFVALRGSTSELVVRKGAPRAKHLTAASEDQGVQMVVNGEADAMIADFPICIVSAYRHRDAGLVAANAPITYEPIGIAVPKGDPHLVNWLENVLDGLRKSNLMKALGEKWFAEPTWVDQLK
jgi:polar amino acid transport system substrate-binding protein